MFNKIKRIVTKETQIFKNIFGAFVVKGASMVLSLFTMPAYLRYFNDNVVLGVWFTILSLINWIMMFDLGIGNGLRNKLPFVLTKEDNREAKEYLSSSYIAISIVAILLSSIFILVQPLLNWNSMLNVADSIISREVLQMSVVIVALGIFIRFVLNLSNSIFYALQKSAVNNFLAFISNLGIFIYVSLAPVASVEQNLINLSYANVIFSNLPLLIATIYLFVKPLKGLYPRFKYFNFSKAKEILKIGVVLLWLQIVAMVVFSTHAVLISNLRSPDEVVEYNIYYKIFNMVASIFALALAPIWSAVTKAQAEKKYSWVNKLYTILLVLPFVVLGISLLMIPFLQFAFDIWLGNDSIQVNFKIAIIMALFNFLFVLHNVNTSVNNGLSFFKVQNIWMSVAAVLMIPLCFVFCNLLDSWTGVILGSCIAILPYEVLQPFFAKKKIRTLENNNL